MKLTDGVVTLRKLTDKDIPFLVKYANNPKVAVNLRDAFPSPYTWADAEGFIKMANKKLPVTIYAIEYEENYVGNMSLLPGTDVYRNSAEIGYFIGEPFWGLGIATRAVKHITQYGFDELGLIRIHTGVFSFNKASQRVLEKCGYTCEGIFKNAIIKNGTIYDEIRYARCLVIK